MRLAGHSRGRKTLWGTDPVVPPIEIGAVHEWFDDSTRQGVWLPALTILIGLAWRAIDRDDAKHALWIGQRCWPYPHALLQRDSDEPPGDAGDRRLLERSLFVDATDQAERVWSIDLACRNPGVAVVVADGRGLKMADSRRLQLAAASTGVPCLLARPGHERRELSAAKSRWLVRSTASASHEQAWTVELLRCKGVQPSMGSARRWIVRRDHATGIVGEWSPCDVGLVPGVVGGPGAASRAQRA